MPHNILARVNYSRWEIGEQPQPLPHNILARVNYSRWEIGEQPQQGWRTYGQGIIIADGRSGSNRNGDEELVRVL